MITLELAFPALITESSPVWLNVSNLGNRGGVQSISTARGRQRVTDQFSAGRGSAVVYDPDGLLDSRNTSSPYYGQTDLRGRFRISREWAGTTYRLFTGFVQGITAARPPFGPDMTEIRAVDGFDVLSRKRTRISRPEELSGARIVALLDAALWPDQGLASGDWRSIATGDSMMQETDYDVGDRGTSILEAIAHVERSEFGRFFISASGKATWINRHALILSAVYSTPQATFGPGAGNLPYGRFEDPTDDDQLVNRAEGNISGGDKLSVEDIDSIDKYGEYTDSSNASNVLLLDEDELQDLLASMVSRGKSPIRRLGQLPLKPFSSPVLWPVVLGHDLGYRESFLDKPKWSLSTFSRELQIEGIDHRWTYAGGIWDTNWRLSLADPLKYWILGTSRYGIDTRVAY